MVANHLKGVLLCFVAVLTFQAVSPRNAIASEKKLQSGWKLQSSCVDHATGDQVSSQGFSTTGWIDTTIPHTVIGAQVDTKIFPDPFFGMNLRDLPGTDYPQGKIFGYFPMSKSSPYHCSWWYRTTIRTTVAAGRFLRLHFDGINYQANIWFNGEQLANASQVAGAFRAYDFDVSRKVLRGESNTLAIEVFAQTETDLGLDFLDWNPAPADKNMGLWRGVSLLESGSVTIGNPVVTTRFVEDTLLQAELSVAVDVRNLTDTPAAGTLVGTIGPATFKQQVTLQPSEHKIVHFDARHYPALFLHHPRVWWPYQYGEPNLERLHLVFQSNGSTSDEKSIRFGIREASQQLDPQGHTLFRINRRKILIRGGGWTPDLFYREPHARLLQEMEYVKHMNLNAIRLEGKLGSDDLFDLADEMGILVMAGWQCCDHWQHWDKWTSADHAIAHESLYDQITRLRSHPSLLVWLNGSDEAPAPDVEADFLSVLREREWPAAVISAAADRRSSITGPSGVKMSGPYDYVPPEYWYLDKDKLGGGFGFNTETSPGPAIPLQSSIQRTLPRQSWWPIDAQWKFHAGLGKFAQFDLFNAAMNATYGEAKDADRYNLKAQWMAYEGERAMFEAYSANKYVSTGVIQWMLNNAWPSFIWHLYDYYLVPGGGYFGTRKANEPIHAQYRYDSSSLDLVNSTLDRYKGLTVQVRVFDIDSKELMRKSMVLDSGPDSVESLLSLPHQPFTSFVWIEVSDKDGKAVSHNFYAVPTQVASLEWAASTYFYTPAKTYADLRDLDRLPKIHVNARAERRRDGGVFDVTLRNDTPYVAFCIQLRASSTNRDDDIAPSIWSDNYISLRPGEHRTLTVRLPEESSSHPDFRVQGWNVEPQLFKVRFATIDGKRS